MTNRDLYILTPNRSNHTPKLWREAALFLWSLVACVWRMPGGQCADSRAASCQPREGPGSKEDRPTVPDGFLVDPACVFTLPRAPCAFTTPTGPARRNFGFLDATGGFLVQTGNSLPPSNALNEPFPKHPTIFRASVIHRVTHPVPKFFHCSSVRQARSCLPTTEESPTRRSLGPG